VTRRWLWLYRPTAPSVRAQSIQVLNMAHAMASRGHRVTVAVDAPKGAPRPSAEAVWAFYGLAPVEGLRVVVLPSGGTAASLAWRALVARWIARDDGTGVIYARSKRYARDVLRWGGGRVPLVLEVHEVDSRQAQERGAEAQALFRLEAEVLAGARGVVANCPGTLELLREVHPHLPPARASHNATHAGRVRAPDPRAVGVGYVGSVRDYKGLDVVARAAGMLDAPVTLVGAERPEAAAGLVEASGGKLRVEPAVPHVDVPDRLARFRALVLPLSPGLFGERLTSPLKLWDYLASGVPFAGADLPTLQSAAPGAYLPYRPDDAASLAGALRRLLTDDALRAELRAAASVRTWDTRAAEVEAFVDEVLR
jgi:glycosyltransferase involved in cell wall biosynthesis